MRYRAHIHEGGVGWICGRVVRGFVRGIGLFRATKGGFVRGIGLFCATKGGFVRGFVR